MAAGEGSFVNLAVAEQGLVAGVGEDGLENLGGQVCAGDQHDRRDGAAWNSTPHPDQAYQSQQHQLLRGSPRATKKRATPSSQVPSRLESRLSATASACPTLPEP